MKTSNFKKVLALVIAFAMVLSVCTMSFSVSAETADLGYFVFNDGTVDGAWTNGSSQRTVALGSDAVLRIAPQRTGKSQVNITLEKGDLTADDFATVNTLSYYVKNETDAPLTLRYQYYLGNGSAGYFNGWVYLVAADEAEIVPFKANKNGDVTVPAKFEGYVVYDLAKSDNYGNVSLNQGEGVWDNTNLVVDYIKAQSFSNMVMFYTPTDDMLTKAFYLDDVAVSTKTVEELAKFLTGGKIVSYNFNMANSRTMDSDESILYWAKNFESSDAQGNAFPTLVDFDDMDGVGAKFVKTATGAATSTLWVRESFKAAYGTDVAFAPEKAKGIKIDIAKKGNFGVALCVNGEPNKINATLYLVSDTGLVTTGVTKIPDNFVGTAYFVFNDDQAVGLNYNKTYMTWADYVASVEGKISFCVYSTGDAGSEITYGGLSFIYDTTDIASNIKPTMTNPIIYDGTVTPQMWANDGDRSQSWGSAFDVNVEDGKIVATCITAGKTNTQGLIFNNGGKSHELDFDTTAVKGVSFDLKTPDNGVDYKVGITMGNRTGFITYCGGIKAIHKDGTVLTLRAGYVYGGDGTYFVTVPAGFDGKIVCFDVANQGNYYIGAYWNGTRVNTFGEYYAYDYTGIGSKPANLFAGICIDVKATATTGTVLGDTFVYDNLTAVCEDVDTYINNISAEYTAKNAPIVEEELLKGTHIVNDFTGANGNTATHTTSTANVVDVTYGFNDSADMMCAEMVFNGTNASSGQRRVNLAVNQGELDLSRAVGFTYDVNITNPDAFAVSWDLQVIAQKNSLKNVKVYFIDANTGAVTDMGAKFTNKATVKGTVVVLFGEDYAVQDGYGGGTKYTWADFVAANSGKITDIGLWMSDRATTTKTTTDESGNEVTKTVLTDACANFKAQIDSLSFIYEENPILAKMDSILNPDTESYFAPVGDLTKTTFTGWNSLLNFKGNTAGIVAPFTPTVDWNVNTPSGLAYKFNKVETTWTGTGQFKVMNRSGLSNAELAEKEAIAFWVKVPEGETIALNLCLNDEPYTTRTSVMAYDVVKNEAILVENPTAKENYQLDLSGFEGYVIVPLQNALFGKDKAVVGDHTGPISYREFVANKGISQLYFYVTKGNYDRIKTAFWMGEFQFVDSLSEFFGKIGAETTPGDMNYDGETDLRDFVRLKKFNASAKTAIAYQNADVDGNGLFDTAAELVNIKKQNMGVDYKAPEKDASLVEYPETMVGIYHSYYGAWNSKYADIIDESEIVNMYSTTDLYELAQLKENGGYAWFYLHEYFGEEPVFGNSTDGYDREATEINEAYKTALDAKVQQLKKLGLWNTVVGFTDEEILIGDQTAGMTQAQFRIWTKYLAETYGKRFNACLSTYEVKGATTTKDGKTYVTSAANAETYEFVTDIGYDLYTGTLEQHKTMFNNLITNTGNRSDVKYWFYPTAYSGDGNDDDVLSGTPTRTDAACTEQIGIFAAMADVVPEGQLGGYYFYTWSDWSDSYGLESLIEDFDYTETCDALIKLATKYVG